jgi:acetolactate synthase-1/3 small subunit
MKHIISALVENHSGVLARVSGLISGRGFNIDSLAVGETHDPQVSRMTIVTVGDDRVLEQVIKQLNKLIDVIVIEDISEEDVMERELMLVKVSVGQKNRNDVMQLVNTFRAKIVDVNSEGLTIEVTGNESKVDSMLELLMPYGVVEVVRTGVVAMSRKKTLSIPEKKKIKVRKISLTKEEIATKKTASKKQTRKMAKDGM